MTRVLVSGIVLGQRRSGVRRFASNVLPRVAKELAAEGGELALLEPREPTGLATGNAVRSIPSNVVGSPLWRRVRGERRALASAWSTAAERGAPFDLLLSGHLPLPEVAGAPHVHLVHDLRALEGIGPGWKRVSAPFALAHAMRAADHVVCVGPSVRASLLGRHPGLEPHVLGHGGDHLPVVRRARQDFVLVVGHLEPRKNLALVLEAWSQDSSLPDLVVVGAGDDSDQIRRETARAQLAKRVSFQGSVDDGTLAALYAHAGCAVFPSRLEGFGLGLLEARRAGTPFAASDIPAHLERMEPEDPRFGVDDPAACARAIHEALERPDEPRSVPSWQAAASAWTELFRRLSSTGA